MTKRKTGRREWKNFEREGKTSSIEGNVSKSVCLEEKLPKYRLAFSPLDARNLKTPSYPTSRSISLCRFMNKVKIKRNKTDQNQKENQFLFLGPEQIPMDACTHSTDVIIHPKRVVIHLTSCQQKYGIQHQTPSSPSLSSLPQQAYLYTHTKPLNRPNPRMRVQTKRWK